MQKYENMEIRIVQDDTIDLYSVTVNGNTILECLTDEEVDDLKMSEIKKLMEM